MQNVPMRCANAAQSMLFSSAGAAEAVRWVFLGPPGVGKGTYASRVAKAMNVPHIAAGDLVRAEIKSGTALGQQVRRMRVLDMRH